jgi:hypothetical protein
MQLAFALWRSMSIWPRTNLATHPGEGRIYCATVVIGHMVSPILPVLNRLCRGTMDPGLRAAYAGRRTRGLPIAGRIS